MKIYAYTLPHDATKSGWIKIGQASDSDKRIKEQIGATRMHYEKIFDQSALAGKRNVSDHDVHRLLTEKGFQRGEGEWFRCTPEDVQAALDFLKEKYISEDKRSDLSQKFYEELRNWYYWATEEQYQGIFAEREPDPDHALRIIVRLLLCFFLREKELVPKEIFDEDWIHENLKVNEFRYYEAILRNLFFYSLNTPEHKRGELENRKFILHYNKVKDVLHHSIPFLNGGLFNEHPGDDFALNNLYFFSEKHSKPIKALDGMFPVMGIVKILSQYKYTLDETDNSEMIDPEFIGKIFECLLACIDADSQESRRKVTGSYYTPREVVDYMVSEALNAFRESSTAPAEDLLRCKILDPSCGSGAFPCGIMNEMMRRFDPDKTLSQEERYTKKLEILRNVIYGVDIQPMAVQIAIFRLFLSLLQEIVPDKRKPNFGIEPLPNLEYKFVCADTLMGIKGNGDFFAENQSEFDHIRLLKMDYFQKNNAAEKEKLKHRIENIEMGIAAQFQKDVADFQKQIDDLEAEITEMSHESLQDGKVREARLENLQKRLTQSKARLQKMISTEALSALCKWNHFDTEPAPYFDSRWMFGIEKFDIIIGNPPYIGEDDHKAIFEPYKETEIGKRFYKGKMDMFYFFFHRALDILPQGGLALFISTNYWTTADGACKLREDIFNRSEVLSIVNFNQCKVFQTAQGQHNMITVLRRTDTPQNNLTKQVIVNVKSGFNPDLIKQILKGLNPDTVYTTFERKKLFDGNKHYIRFSAGDKMDALLDKIAKKANLSAISFKRIKVLCRAQWFLVTICVGVLRRFKRRKMHRFLSIRKGCCKR